MIFRSLLFVLGLTIVGFTFENNLLKIPKNWPKPVYNFKNNPPSQEKILLGRALFYDPILSANNTISCATCHSQYTAFAHVDHDLSHGIHDRIGTRNAPALMNLAWQKTFMWDGAINHLDMQSLAPISNPLEMDETLANVVLKLQNKKLYRQLFFAAFNDTIITGQNVLKALSSFMVTLVSSNSRYDSMVRNEITFTEQENKGYALFKTHCNNCHTEPLFTNQNFENNGLKPDPVLNDIGRVKISLNKSDSFKFKVPTLRNIDFSYPYMHDGRFKKISDVLKHYSNGIVQSPTLSPLLSKPIPLSANDRADLTVFLLTLTDRNFLFDTAYSFPKNVFLSPAKE